MPIGLQVNNSTSQLNTQLGTTAVAIRDACRNAIQFFQGANSLGLAGLEAIGFTAQDAQDMLNAASHLNTIAQVYYGLATQTPAFNFDDSLAEARGGQ